MRKIFCLFIALVMCLSIAAPVFAADNGFVPSITYKPEPEIVTVKNEKGEDAIGVIRNEKGDVIDYAEHGCLEVTPIAYVWDEEKVVPEEVEVLLTTVYDGLNDGSLEIKYDMFNAGLKASDMVIRDLFDARWICSEHRDLIEKEGVTFEITFDLGVVADAQIFVSTYDETTKEWSPIVKTVNNGDGTVTCTFEHLCAVAFSMPLAGTTVPVEDAPATNLLPWIIILVLAIVAFVVVVIIKNKKAA